MNKISFPLLAVCLVCCALGSSAQPGHRATCNFILLDPSENLDSIVNKAAHLGPSPRQFAWQEMEFTFFIHFGMNTFTDREWGEEGTDPVNFNPTELDARQWARVARMAGAKLMIVVAKHHDGFCLWPSKYTDYSVRNSPWKNGKGDVIKDVAEACREYDIKLGIYLSPWDINSPIYGTDEYNEYFKNQLRELLTNYGEISEVWFDGACGEGPNGKRQVYDWQGYYQVMRELAPDAVIAVMGPDVRWVGTESGYGRETEWSVVPVSGEIMKMIEESTVESMANMAFVPLIDPQQPDLGSREKLAGSAGLVWYPSEVDVSIRPGWFYHSNQDSLVKSPEELVDIYYSSVGRNSLLLLNVPPEQRGLIHENDVASLKGMREILDATFDTNLVVNSITTEDPYQFIYEIKEDQSFNTILLQENIRNGQRIEEFVVEAISGGEWKEVARGATVGYKRLLRVENITARSVRLTVISSRGEPEIKFFGVYK